MKLPDLDILLVESDEPVAEVILEHLGASLGWNDGLDDGPAVHIRHAQTVERALTEHQLRPAHIVVAAQELPDGSGTALIRQLRAHAPCEAIVLTNQATLSGALEALRLGVVDLLAKPFDLAKLTQVVDQALARHREQRVSEVRLRRLRELATRIVRERRELRRRVDLVCHDLVGAYRSLAQKFVEQEQA